MGNKLLTLGLWLSMLLVSLAQTTSATPLSTNSYVISNEAGVLSGLTKFFVAAAGATPESAIVRDRITQILSSYGYQAIDFAPRQPNLIVILFNVTNEVRNLDVYKDESQYAIAAEYYRMFTDTARTMYPETRDMTKNSLVRRNKVALRVELVTIYAYVMPNELSAKKVWESGAGSVEGSSADLLTLTTKALSAFPRCAP